MASSQQPQSVWERRTPILSRRHNAVTSLSRNSEME
ncbi:unnamed protein product, partial [Rotaria magnacalcarata]